MKWAVWHWKKTPFPHKGKYPGNVEGPGSNIIISPLPPTVSLAMAWRWTSGRQAWSRTYFSVDSHHSEGQWLVEWQYLNCKLSPSGQEADILLLAIRTRNCLIKMSVKYYINMSFTFHLNLQPTNAYSLTTFLIRSPDLCFVYGPLSFMASFFCRTDPLSSVYTFHPPSFPRGNTGDLKMLGKHSDHLGKSFSNFQ